MLKRPNLAPAIIMTLFAFMLAVPIYLFAAAFGHSEILFLDVVTFGFTLLLFVRAYLQRASRVRAADQDLVRQEQGEIIWQGNKYIARTPTCKLTTVNNITLPPPGPYHFYYLSASSILLAADPIKTYTGMIAYPDTLSASGLPGNEQARIALQEALCHTIHFTLNDLNSNQMGVISKEQRGSLSQKLRRTFLAPLICIPLGVGLLLQSGVISPTGIGSAFSLNTFLFIGGAALLLFGLYQLTFSTRARWQEIQRAEITILTGQVSTRKISSGTDGGGDNFYYYIDSTLIPVSKEACDALMPNTRYRLYYLRHMKTLLSIEPLEAPPRS